MGLLSLLPNAITAKFTQYSTGLLTSLHLLWRWIRTGGAALRIKERQRPKMLDKYTHMHTLLPSGIDMHYVEAGNRSAPLMVMVHGFPEFWYSWRFQIDHFKDRYRVVAIDQRGYGDTTKPAAIGDYRTSTLAKDLDDLIHALGADSAVVVAHDWGAWVAWTHAILYPKSVNRLIICNLPHPYVLHAMISENERQRKASWYMFFYQNPWLPEAIIAADDFKMFDACFWSKAIGLRNRDNFTEEDMEAWKYTFSQKDALNGPINFYRAAFQYPDTKAVTAKCTVKTLIVWGDNDGALLKEGAEESLKWCDDAQLRYVPGASHWVQQDEPIVVNKYIDEFLGSAKP
uniref:Ceeh-1 n=1 Tax=Pristionchus pacificus TaxID=54126 RepID=A0A454XK06_PRIPA|eukprot:PDM82299.1 ceeh-1 [Pristionchus pacificus]